MHISRIFEKVDVESAKVDIESVKVDIESVKADIESVKVDIRNKILLTSKAISEKTINYAIEIFARCGKDIYFGRTQVQEITGLKSNSLLNVLR